MNYIIKKIVIFLDPDTEDKEIIEYELESLTYEFLNIFIAILIVVLFNKGLMITIYVALICIIRQYTGGHHFDTHLKCFLGFEVMILLIILLDFLNIHDLVIHIATIISIVIIYLYSPLEHKNNPFTLMMKHNNRNKSVLILIIFIIIYLSFNIFSIKYYNIISYVLLSDAVLMIAGMVSGDCVNV